MSYGLVSSQLCDVHDEFIPLEDGTLVRGLTAALTCMQHVCLLQQLGSAQASLQRTAYSVEAEQICLSDGKNL